MNGPQGEVKPCRNPGHDDQVDVIRHEAVRDDLYFVISRVRVKQGQIGLLVALGEEHAIAVVSALRDVVRQPGEYGASMARHALKLMETGTWPGP